MGEENDTFNLEPFIIIFLMCEGYVRSIFTVEFRSSDCSENYDLKSALKAAN